jgi:hypothetical protein
MLLRIIKWYCCINREKVNTFQILYCVKFQYTDEKFNVLQKVSMYEEKRNKISLFKGLSLIPKLISHKNSTMGDQYYPKFERKNLTYGVNVN